MACCNKNQLLAGVALLDGLQDYNMGTCVKQRHLAIYNAEVTDVVISTQGIPVRLTPQAQEMIKSKYTGIPLYVMRQCCAGCKTPSGEFACCGDFRSAAIPAVTGIWFGKQDSDQGIGGFAGCLVNALSCGCALSINQCRLNRIAIPYDSVKAAWLEAQKPEGKSME